MTDYYQNVLKQQLPPKPILNKDVLIKFKEKNRDKFTDLLKEALKQ